MKGLFFIKDSYGGIANQKNTFFSSNHNRWCSHLDLEARIGISNPFYVYCTE